ncbi:phage major tail protein, TP901-1 family [Staphylococcus xylosus]
MKMKHGNERLILFRKLGQKIDASKLLYLTEYGLSHEADSDTENTMDGSYTTGGSVESSLSGTAKLAYGDTFADEIEDAVVDRIAYEAWEIESKIPGTGENANKFKAKYFQGYHNKFELKAEVDGVDEYEYEYAVSGRFQRGYATLPETVTKKINASGYRFHNTTKDDPADDGLATIPQPQADSTPKEA